MQSFLHNTTVKMLSHKSRLYVVYIEQQNHRHFLNKCHNHSHHGQQEQPQVRLMINPWWLKTGDTWRFGHWQLTYSFQSFKSADVLMRY